jgi:hypothetical protein
MALLGVDEHDRLGLKAGATDFRDAMGGPKAEATDGRGNNLPRGGTLAREAATSTDTVEQAQPVGASAQTEEAIADKLRLHAAAHLTAFAKVMDEARAHGMSIHYQIGIGPSGKHLVSPIDIVKHL